MSKGKELLKSFDYIDDKYLDLVEEMTVRKNRIWWKSRAAIAACVALVLVSGSAVAYATDLFGLRKMVVRTEKKEVLTEEPFEPVSEEILPGGKEKVVYNEAGDSTIVSVDGTTEEAKPVPTSTGDNIEIVSLAGFAGTPEANAATEWEEYTEEYTAHHELTNEEYDPGMYGADIKNYTSVYDAEMADKLREIAGKYNLKFHTELTSIAFDDFDSYFGGRLYPDTLNECFGGHGYTDGTIYFSATFLDEYGYQFSTQFSSHPKGYMNDVYLNIGNTEDYIQEEYVTKDGTKVLLALSPYKGLIVADFDDKFVVVNMLLDMYEKIENDDCIEGEYSMDKLKEFADQWNLELLTN